MKVQPNRKLTGSLSSHLAASASGTNSSTPRARKTHPCWWFCRLFFAVIVSSAPAQVGPLNCIPPPPGMLAWWPGDGNPNDLLGTNNWALYGGATFGPGEVGLAFSFPGGNAYAAQPLPQSFKAGNITLAAWVNLQTTSNTQAILSLEPSGANDDGRGFDLFIDNGNAVAVIGSGSGHYTNIVGETTLQDNQWYHVVGTYDGATLAVYVNGSLDNARADATGIKWSDRLTIPASANWPSNAFMYISGYKSNQLGPGPNAADEYFLSKGGRIDEAAIWNRALDPGEIAAIYAAGSAGMCKESDPSITVQPSNVTVTTGQAAAFTVAASGPALSYQWYKDGAQITGATNATYVIQSATANDAGTYTVLVSNYAATFASVSATLSLNTPPAIVTPPASQTVNAGSAASFMVVASGSELNYQWMKDGAAIAGATNATYVITSATADDAGQYRVVVSNSAATVTSTPATLTVIVPPLITAQPSSQTVFAGGTVAFSVAAVGTAPFGYQWQFNGGNIPGATNATLSLPNVTEGQSGTYTVVVSNAAGSVTSGTAVLTVESPPSIPVLPGDITVWEGQTALFAVDLSTIQVQSIAWLKNGFAIQNATNQSFIIGSVQLSDSGGYSVTMQTAGGSLTSETAQLTVLDATPPVIQCSSNLTVAATQLGGALVNYVVSATDNTDPNPAVQCYPPSGSVFPLGTTTVACTATDSNANFSTCSFDVTVIDPSTTALSALVAGSTALLSWPITYTPYALEVTPTLATPIPWGRIDLYPSAANGSNTIAIPLSQDALYFRLRGLPIIFTARFQADERSTNLAAPQATVTVDTSGLPPPMNATPLTLKLQNLTYDIRLDPLQVTNHLEWEIVRFAAVTEPLTLDATNYDSLYLFLDYNQHSTGMVDLATGESQGTLYLVTYGGVADTENGPIPFALSSQGAIRLNPDGSLETTNLLAGTVPSSIPILGGAMFSIAYDGSTSNSPPTLSYDTNAAPFNNPRQWIRDIWYGFNPPVSPLTNAPVELLTTFDLGGITISNQPPPLINASNPPLHAFKQPTTTNADYSCYVTSYVDMHDAMNRSVNGFSTNIFSDMLAARREIWFAFMNAETAFALEYNSDGTVKTYLTNVTKYLLQNNQQLHIYVLLAELGNVSPGSKLLDVGEYLSSKVTGASLYPDPTQFSFSGDSDRFDIAVQPNPYSPFGIHHEKFILMDPTTDGAVLWCAGFNLAHDYWDTLDHPQPDPFLYDNGPILSWHDSAVRVVGPAIRTFEIEFRRRWGLAYDLQPGPAAFFYSLIPGVRALASFTSLGTSPPKALPPYPFFVWNTNANATVDVQSLIHQEGVAEQNGQIWSYYKAGIDSALDSMYIENQYCHDDLIPQALISAYMRNTNLQIAVNICHPYVMSPSIATLEGTMKNIARLRIATANQITLLPGTYAPVPINLNCLAILQSAVTLTRPVGGWPSYEVNVVGPSRQADEHGISTSYAGGVYAVIQTNLLSPAVSGWLIDAQGGIRCYSMIATNQPKLWPKSTLFDFGETPIYLHSKCAIFDSRPISDTPPAQYTIGSCNLGPQSFKSDSEANIAVLDTVQTDILMQQLFPPLGGEQLGVGLGGWLTSLERVARTNALWLANESKYGCQPPGAPTQSAGLLIDYPYVVAREVNLISPPTAAGN